MRTCRILINTPSSFGGIGDLYNFKMKPSLTLGCGTWGGNSVSENVGVKHLLNIKTVAIRRENMLWLRLPEKVYFKKGCLPVALQELKDVLNKDFREFVGFFIYHDYVLEDIIQTISTNTLWKPNQDIEHFDCLIHNGAKYIKDIIARRPHSLPEISFMIRDKKITKEEGILLLEKEKQYDIKKCQDELTLMCSFMKLSKKKLLFKAKLYAKRWW
jgi:hypothetical protein